MQGITYLLYAERDLSYCVVTVKAATVGKKTEVLASVMYNKRFGTWGDGRDHPHYAVVHAQSCLGWEGSVGTAESKSGKCR